MTLARWSELLEQRCVVQRAAPQASACADPRCKAPRGVDMLQLLPLPITQWDACELRWYLLPITEQDSEQQPIRMQLSNTRAVMWLTTARTPHRAVLARLRGGSGWQSVGLAAREVGVFSCTPHPLANSRSASSTAQKSPAVSQRTSSLLCESITNDIAALELVRDAFSSDAELNQSFEQAMEHLVQCTRENRKIFVTGIGKSGIVARRLASSLASISVSSQWVHGSEWIHGELGGLTAGDVVIMLSHSGRTSELVDLPARFQSAGCSVVSITGDASSPLSTTSDFTIAAEAHDNPKCPVPSRSIVVQEALCNGIIEHMLANTTDATAGFRRSHPGGAIGEFNF